MADLSSTHCPFEVAMLLDGSQGIAATAMASRSSQSSPAMVERRSGSITEHRSRHMEYGMAGWPDTVKVQQ